MSLLSLHYCLSLIVRSVLLFSVLLPQSSLLLLGNTSAAAVLAQEQRHSFTVDYTNGRFLKDGRAYRYISGEIHYSRIHPTLWADRLQRVRALGLNAVQTYVPWNYHERQKEVLVF